MIKRMTLMLFVVGLFFGGVFGWKAFQAFQMNQQMMAAGMPPVTVSTTMAANETWTPVIPSVGTLRASQGVDITAQEEGIITELRFDSGAEVEQGDVIAQQYVDDERARLKALEADVELAELNLARAEDLLKKKLNSQFDYDTRKTDRDRAVAQARNLRLIIEKKTIRAPFTGRIGIRQVDLGQYVNPGDSIVRLEALAEILVDFPVPQRSIGLVRVGQRLAIHVDAYPDVEFSGRVTAISPHVRAQTRDVRIEGVIDNEAQQLLPGMFAEIRIQLPEQEEVVTLPQSTITYSPYGNSLFIIEEIEDGSGNSGLVARNRFVEVGDTRGDQVAVLSGVAAGEMVVTAGQVKLRNDSPVVIDNSVIVSNEATPTLENN